MKREWNAFIFDLDGVIVFTDRYHYLAWKGLADRLKIPFDEKMNNRLRGVSRMASLEIVLEQYTGKPLSDKDKAALAEEKNEAYKMLLENMGPSDVSDAVRVTLKTLRERGYKLAIGSSSKNTKFILRQVGLLEAFDAISDGTNIVRSKPDPEVFLKAAAFLGVAPENCIVVEDARAGIDAAKAANMTAVAIGDAADYEKADYRIHTFDQLITIFAEA